MKKIRILAALMALLLCVSMLLTACGNKDKNPETEAPDATDAGDAAEGEGEGEDKEDTKDPADTDKPAEEKPAEVKPLPTVKLADIMNKNWTLEKAETLSKIEKIEYAGNYSTNHCGVSSFECFSQRTLYAHYLHITSDRTS